MPTAHLLALKHALHGRVAVIRPLDDGLEVRWWQPVMAENPDATHESMWRRARWITAASLAMDEVATNT